MERSSGRGVGKNAGGGEEGRSPDLEQARGEVCACPSPPSWPNSSSGVSVWVTFSGKRS